MLATIGTFLARSENSFFTAFRRTLAQHPLTALITTGLLAAVSIFSLLFATIPGEPLDRMLETVTGRADKTSGSSFRRSGYLGFTVPFMKPAEDGSLFGLFYRNLVVRDADLVVDNAVTAGEASDQSARPRSALCAPRSQRPASGRFHRRQSGRCEFRTGRLAQCHDVVRGSRQAAAAGRPSRLEVHGCGWRRFHASAHERCAAGWRRSDQCDARSRGARGRRHAVPDCAGRGFHQCQPAARGSVGQQRSARCGILDRVAAGC